MMEKFNEYTKIYTEEQENSIRKEFPHLKGNCYLDHAGATLYSKKQLDHAFFELTTNLFGNPHARNLASKATEDSIDIIRYQILEHFNTSSDEYSVIFTSNASHAIKIVGESFRYKNDDGNAGVLAHLENNHTSVLGMRNFAPKTMEIKTEIAFQILSTDNVDTGQDNSNSIFVYPAQCNFSGTKYPLTWIEKVQNKVLNNHTNTNSKNWYVLLDAASFVSTNYLDLSKWKPDFIPISFYKIFGYPTGLGALLVRKSSEQVLDKKFFGGGTVLMALSSQNIMIPRPTLHERFEDGTLPFLSILAVKHGFETIKRLPLNFHLISKHTFALAQYVFKQLLVLHHSNGTPVCILYHETMFESIEHQGAIINFNLLRPTGEFIGYSEVLHFANLHGVQLRTGCFCNPGACQRFLKLSSDDVQRHFDAGHVCGDQHDLVDNYPTGSIRISFGYMSTKEDADIFLGMIQSCFVSKPIIKKIPANYSDLNNKYLELFQQNSLKFSKDPSKEINDNCKSRTNNLDATDLNLRAIYRDSRQKNAGVLEKILLYPIKSCAAFAVLEKWILTPTGLKYDRQWMIVNSSGICVTQKHNKKLCLIKPSIDLKKSVLKLAFLGSDSIELPLNGILIEKSGIFPCKSKVCGDEIHGWDCGDNVAEWLSKVLNQPGMRLLKQCNESEDVLGRISKKLKNHQLSLVNKAQYLLVNTASVQWLKDKIPKEDLDENLETTIDRFRANFVVKFNEAFYENDFTEFLFGDKMIFKSGGKCTRCQMICVNQSSGEASKEPLATISREFKGKISFGLYLNNESPEKCEIQLGINVIGIN